MTRFLQLFPLRFIPKSPFHLRAGKKKVTNYLFKHLIYKSLNQK